MPAARRRPDLSHIKARADVARYWAKLLASHGAKRIDGRRAEAPSINVDLRTKF